MSDRQEQLGQQWLEEFLKLANLSAPITTEMKETFSETSCWLTIDDSALKPDQIEALIGTQGAALDSIQYLANSTLNLGRAEDQQGAYTIELAGYRQRRQQELLEIANQAAEEVRQTGKEVEIKLLSSAERRQIHTILKESADLATYSRGQEPDRRLVVQPASLDSESA
ncbi:MAG: RNA-binding protein [Phormidesmis sp. CAN_BIN44]|nr:RNA-binding protein [Phormidesmis sp. CAN_BIN44]